ncbi:MAG: hypothetical protein AAF715_10980 [Myxococcota bacterium]
MRPIRRSSFIAVALLGAATALSACADYEQTRGDFTATPEHYACTLGGASVPEDWDGNWGEIGSWCDPRALEAEGLAVDVAATVEARYPGLIIEDRIGPWADRKPVIAKLVKTIAVSSHIAADRVGARDAWSEDTAEAFVLTALATVYQQSYFGHYKRIDGAVRLMRGGRGHHHGVMQLDDQWHHDAVYAGAAGWDLLTNLEFGLGLLVDAYLHAEDASCVTDARSRARAAYSVYHSGHAREACRWAERPSSADRNFVRRWDDITRPGRLAAYDWVIDFEGALAGTDDIDYAGILGLEAWPGGAGHDGGDAACHAETTDAPETEATALDLGDGFSGCDDAGPPEVTGRITDNLDADWYTYTAARVEGCFAEPTLIMDAEPGLMVCQYVSCVGADAPPSFTCPFGTAPDVSGEGRAGCCSNTGGFSIDDVVCPAPVENADLTVHLRLQSVAIEVDDFCSDYAFRLHQ